MLLFLVLDLCLVLTHAHRHLALLVLLLVGLLMVVHGHGDCSGGLLPRGTSKPLLLSLLLPLVVVLDDGIKGDAHQGPYGEAGWVQ